jgi:hypothetical protein
MNEILHQNTKKGFVLLAVVILLSSCFGRGYLKSPAQKIQQAQNRHMLMGIKMHGRTGDWVLVRGYTQMSDIIANVTGGIFSHVALLDKEMNQVIESDHAGVHSTPLKEFADKTHRIVLVRPKWRTSRQVGRAAIEEARRLFGKPYDYIGILGIHIADSYFCSELAIKVYKPFMKKEDKSVSVVAPLELLNWGKIVYDSGNRDVIGDSINDVEEEYQVLKPLKKKADL